MKIAVLGNIVDTELIWKIGPIETVSRIRKTIEAPHSRLPIKLEVINKIDFTIYFFNEKKLTIELSTEDFDDNFYLFADRTPLSNNNIEKYTKRIIEFNNRSMELNQMLSHHIYRVLEDLRNRVANAWQQSEKEIPRFEFSCSTELEVKENNNNL
jgi:hypothetical protein